MGYSMHKIPVSNALYLCRSWNVVSASTEVYFRKPAGAPPAFAAWAKERNIASAELVDGQRRVFLNLKNGDFVELEAQKENQ